MLTNTPNCNTCPPFADPAKDGPPGDAQSAFERGQRATAPDSEQSVVNHEVGHANSFETDPLAESKRSEKEAEDIAEDFDKKARNEKDTLSKEEAEKRVREILELPEKPKKK